MTAITTAQVYQITGFRGGVADELGTMSEAAKRLLSWRLLSSVSDVVDFEAVISGPSLREWSDGNLDAYQYEDGSVIADDGNGYQSFPDFAAVIEFTGWDAEDFANW